MNELKTTILIWTFKNTKIGVVNKTSLTDLLCFGFVEAPEETYDPRSLYDRLQEQKLKKDAEYEEAHKLSKLINKNQKQNSCRIL